MIKEQRKYCYGVYSFVWGAGVEDGLSQHFSALAYYGEALREFFRNLLAGHPKLVMWDMSLGYGADILSTLNYYAIGDPLNLLYGFVSPKNTETMYNFMIVLRMYRILLSTRTAPSILHQSDDLFSAVMSWD